MIFGKKNPRETVPEGGTRQGGAPHPPGRTPDSRGHPVRRLVPFFRRKKANIRIKIVSSQSELRISGNIRNGERVESENAETERDRETDPISEGLSPLPRHGDHGPEGKSFSHLGRRSRKKKKKKGALSPLSRWHRDAARAIIITAIFTNNFTAIITNSSPLYAAV